MSYNLSWLDHDFNGQMKSPQSQRLLTDLKQKDNDHYQQEEKAFLDRLRNDHYHVFKFFSHYDEISTAPGAPAVPYASRS